MIDISNYEKIREDAEKYYISLPDLDCKAVPFKVSFSSNGFNHLIYRKGRTERDRISQIMRFKLLTKAYELISLTTTFQEYENSLKEFKVKKHKEKVYVTKQVQYWGLIAIMGDRKIKVILRKIGNGNLHFWSVVPAWVTNKTRDGKFIRTMKGDPEID
ncbi:hypothetical protein A3C57_02680 [Candidatus Nomurabacteria bacterium RIFCSPHIGHO2_02_FULL_33_12]|uniref:Phage-Barnase-EndoU-ColicinE5/D-RelE like nuclease 2 domain-containing protein n=1 Tax=Candidatus Nomurabacteria bacterium RIFCSPLOWO2_01_FULL_33_17 TaxID=1801764 RepID=A0A1F6WP20_9BACT|nr:MAG: hypothetical protein A3C57_02680 [Candidatus Nomurabacteria bacterium RIFCSPHIGHO2_02_FULL_33_12]OGI83576.1 MAG: hypothetical protein A2903_02560 [Candidatus Nomurabacteria bacterium RIFCSPLOWO2_01_FULL_33_17]